MKFPDHRLCPDPFRFQCPFLYRIRFLHPIQARHPYRRYLDPHQWK